MKPRRISAAQCAHDLVFRRSVDGVERCTACGGMRYRRGEGPLWGDWISTVARKRASRAAKDQP